MLSIQQVNKLSKTLLALIIIVAGIIFINKYINCESFEAQQVMDDWFQEEKQARNAYLDKLIQQDYIQSYPWMASNPGGVTSYNSALFNQSSQQPVYKRQPQTYYDFGEITYIGNPL